MTINSNVKVELCGGWGRDRDEQGRAGSKDVNDADASVWKDMERACASTANLMNCCSDSLSHCLPITGGTRNDFMCLLLSS